jgi:hypothetical protein
MASGGQCYSGKLGAIPESRKAGKPGHYLALEVAGA